MVETLKELFQNDVVQALIIFGLTAIISTLFTKRGKLVWGFSHQHFYRITRIDGEGVFPIRTQQVWFQNTGRAAVEEIEIVLNWKPQHFEIWNPRKYETSELEDSRFIIQIPYLSDNEAFTISMLDSFKDLPSIVNVRSKTGQPKSISMRPQRIVPRSIIFVLTSLIMIGFSTVLFLLLKFLQHVI